MPCNSVSFLLRLERQIVVDDIDRVEIPAFDGSLLRDWRSGLGTAILRFRIEEVDAIGDDFDRRHLDVVGLAGVLSLIETPLHGHERSLAGELGHVLAASAEDAAVDEQGVLFAVGSFVGIVHRECEGSHGGSGSGLPDFGVAG